MANIEKHSDRFHDGWTRAVHLRRWLGGGNPPVRRSQQFFITRPDESYFCTVGAGLHLYIGADVEYSQGMFLAGGGFTGLALTAGASMLVNKHNRDRAAREAAPQWRNFGEVGVHITDQRLVTTIDGRLESLWYYGGMTLFDPKWEEYAAYVGVEGAPPLRFVGAGVPYVSVLVYYLLFGEVPSMTTAG